jgi:hypothetical protein
VKHKAGVYYSPEYDVLFIARDDMPSCFPWLTGYSMIVLETGGFINDDANKFLCESIYVGAL